MSGLPTNKIGAQTEELDDHALPQNWIDVSEHVWEMEQSKRQVKRAQKFR